VLARVSLATTRLVAAAGAAAGDLYVSGDRVLDHPFLFGALAWVRCPRRWSGACGPVRFGQS
jgi:hypothetical protein